MRRSGTIGTATTAARAAGAATAAARLATAALFALSTAHPPVALGQGAAVPGIGTPGAAVPGVGPRPPAPIVESASPISREVMEASTAYADCVRRRQDEVQRHSLATQVRDFVDHRERYAAELRANPQVAKKYPGGVDQMIDEAYRQYRAAGGTAPTPQAVQPGEPPCARAIPAQAPERARRALKRKPPALETAQVQLEQCAVRNAPAYQLHRASTNVVAAVHRRDELRETGERLNWSGASRENYRGAERIVEDSFARYRSLGGTAAAAEQVTHTEDPCRDEGEQLNNMVRHVYAPGAQPLTQTRSMPAQPGGAGTPAPPGSAGTPAPPGSVPVPQSPGQ